VVRGCPGFGPAAATTPSLALPGKTSPTPSLVQDVCHHHLGKVGHLTNSWLRVRRLPPPTFARIILIATMKRIASTNTKPPQLRTGRRSLGPCMAEAPRAAMVAVTISGTDGRDLDWSLGVPRARATSRCDGSGATGRFLLVSRLPLVTHPHPVELRTRSPESDRSMCQKNCEPQRRPKF
jgi:hypothetical protein